MCLYNIVFRFVYGSVEHAVLEESFRFSKVVDNIYLDLQKKIFFLGVCCSSKFANCKCTHGTKSVMYLRTRLVCSEIIYISYGTPKVTKYQRCSFIIQIHRITIKIDKININLLFECVKIVEFNFNSHVFHVMYQETRFLNQDACFLNQEGRRQFLISFVSERD